MTNPLTYFSLMTGNSEEDALRQSLREGEDRDDSREHV